MIKYKGVELVEVEATEQLMALDCLGCYFENINCSNIGHPCSKGMREDGNNIIFIKKEVI